MFGCRNSIHSHVQCKINTFRICLNNIFSYFIWSHPFSVLMYHRLYFWEFSLSFATKDFLLHTNLASYLYKVIKNSIFFLILAKPASWASNW